MPMRTQTCMKVHVTLVWLAVPTAVTMVLNASCSMFQSACRCQRLACVQSSRKQLSGDHARGHARRACARDARKRHARAHACVEHARGPCAEGMRLCMRGGFLPLVIVSFSSCLFFERIRPWVERSLNGFVWPSSLCMESNHWDGIGVRAQH